MQLWLIPTFYAAGSVIAGLLVPRLETALLGHSLGLSAASAQAYLSAVASGMMALTGIVFSIAFVLVQFNAIVYSPRLVVWFARDRLLFHSLGMFVATFMFSLATLAWTDRTGSGGVPLLSAAMVATMLIVSVLMLSQLVQRLSHLQITQVLHTLGDTGREVILGTYQDVRWSRGHDAELAPASVTFRHTGRPRSVTSIDIKRLASLARGFDGIITLQCAVGDTLIEGSDILCVHGGTAVSEDALRTCVRFGDERTFEQDPKYALRLLVDIAIKALSPAINDPTTGVQAIDQIEDLLRRLARCDLEASSVLDEDGRLRVICQMPTWEDYLSLGFDEIRQFGSTSIQIMRRLRSALVELLALVGPERARSVRAYLDHLDAGIETSGFDSRDRAAARVEDRQGLGLSHQAVNNKRGAAAPGSAVS
jgi:uncharacterized membrane protein